MRGYYADIGIITPTYNAIFPVLGDAELIVGLKTDVVSGRINAEICERYMGSFDFDTVREFVE